MSKNQDEAAVYNILLFAFEGEKTAERIMKQVKSSGDLEGYKIVAEAVIEQDEKGKVHIHEPGHGTAGTVVGAVAGGLLGLIGGPVGLLAWAVGGAVVGGVAGKYLGRPISKGDLEEIGNALELNSSAMLLLLEDKETEGVINSMEEYNANVVTLTVGSELSGEIATYVAGQATDAEGNVVAGKGGVVVDAEGNVVAGKAGAAADAVGNVISAGKGGVAVDAEGNVVAASKVAEPVAEAEPGDESEKE
jgi:uncharacterized membrane protein